MFFHKKESESQKPMMLKVCGSGPSVHYVLSSYSTKRLRWVSPDDPETFRIPEERSSTYMDCPFQAAGQTYRNRSELCVEGDGAVMKDVYGREVICVRNRFPCFDSYDYLYEDRYYRWFLIRNGNSLTRVFCTDSRPEIYVTEDVESLENGCVSLLEELGLTVK